MKIKAKYATKFYDKVFGLIEPKNQPPLLLFTRCGIHTYFLKYSIDVLILDKNLIVKKIRENLPPFSFYFYNPAYCYVLELRSGFVKKTKISVGDKIVVTK